MIESAHQVYKLDNVKTCMSLSGADLGLRTAFASMAPRLRREAECWW